MNSEKEKAGLSQKNLRKYYLQTATYALVAMFLNGAIAQTFLLTVGLSESDVYTYSSIIQFSQVAVMVFMVFLSGRLRHEKTLAAISSLSMLAPICILMIAAINPAVVSGTFVGILFVVTMIVFGGMGMHNVLTYCLPYKLIDMADYGKLTGIGGAVSGAVTFLVSSLHTFVVSQFDYVGSMIWFFSVAGLAAIFEAVMYFTMKELPRDKADDLQKSVDLSELVAVFKNPDTYYLLIPNFARGIALGVFNVLAIMAVGAGVTDAAGASSLNLILQLSSFGASVVFSVLYKKIKVEKMLLICTAFICVLLPFILSLGFIPFLVISLLALFFRFIVDSAIPVALVSIIPESQMGAYSSIRMLILTAAQAIAAILVLPLVSLVGYFGVLVIASALQLICGIGHYAVTVHREKVINSFHLIQKGGENK